VYSHVPLKAKR